MPVDRLLGTLLRSLQTYTDQQDTPRLLSTAASLLTTLTNPLNVTLLTHQLLTAPALWSRPDGLRSCLRHMSVFHSAARAILEHERTLDEKRVPRIYPFQTPMGGGLKNDKWIRAVLKAADERSERWKHLMVIGGLLIGFASYEQEHGYETLSRGMRRTLESALVNATNLALEEVRDRADDLGAQCITLVMNHSFPMISEYERTQLDYDALLPAIVGAAFFSQEGLQSAYFLGVVDMDVVEVPGKRLNWAARSSSFKLVEEISSRPLVSSMGPLSRLVCHAAENVKDPWLVQNLVDELTDFSRALLTQWRQNKLSSIEAAEESVDLHEEAFQTTMPVLWKLLKNALFATVIVLRGCVGRLLNDAYLASSDSAPQIVTQTLHTLRNLYFITARLGPNAFTQYTFVYLTSIDILATHASISTDFLTAIRPTTLGSMPPHPLDRTLDLYFLNTSEHFTLTLSAATNKELLIPSTLPYLSPTTAAQPALLPLFEAAHSVMLAVLSAPQSVELAGEYIPFYVDALFAVFPENLSPRQFRLAFKTLMRVVAPPAPLAAQQVDLPNVLLELVYYRATRAPTKPLLVNPSQAATALAQSTPQVQLSEQGALILTLLDSLSFLPPQLLEEWLELTTGLVNQVPDEGMKRVCRQRFWELMVSGEMDPERSAVCVSWWGSRGGRERVMLGWDVNGNAQGKEEEGAWMSGALPVEGRDSKL